MPDAATAPPPSSPDQCGWPSAQSKDGVLRLPPKPRRPQPLDVMPDAQPGVETIADYRADASNPVVSPWSLPLFEWSPRRRCCFTVVSFGVEDGTLRLVCSPLRVGSGSAAVCGPPIAVRCLFDATLHRGRCGAVPEALVGRHVTVWDPFVWIAADGLHEVQVDSAKDVAFHLTAAEVAHYSAMDEQDGGYALRWLRKGKADGDTLVKQNEYAAALRAYVHGLCKCYTRGPLDQPSSCIDELFTVSTLLGAAFKSYGAMMTSDDLRGHISDEVADSEGYLNAWRSLCAGAQLLFAPDAGMQVFHGIPPLESHDRIPVIIESLFTSVRRPRNALPDEVLPRTSGAPEQLVASNMSLVDVCAFLQSYPLVAKYLGNVTLACRKLQLWSPCFTTAIVASFMAPDHTYRDKYQGFAAIAVANMGFNASPLVTGEYAVRSKRVCDLLQDYDIIPTAEEVPDAPPRHIVDTEVRIINSAKGRGVFATRDLGSDHICISLPFASSTGADLASIHYLDWTVPRDFAGLFRVLQQQCAAPCADLFMQQLHFLDGRNDGEYRQTLPWTNVPVSTIKQTPFLFHDLSVPLKAPVSTDEPSVCYVGHRALFDAARAIEVVGANAIHAPTSTCENGDAVLHIGFSMCNHSSLPNTGLSKLWYASPVLTLQPFRPIRQGEEITILYPDHPDGHAVFANRWGGALGPPPELQDLCQMLYMELARKSAEFTRHEALRMIVEFGRHKLKWSVSKCETAYKAPFIDFMFDVFKECETPIYFLLHHLATHGDDVIKAALLKDPRLVSLAIKLDVPVSHFA